MGNFASCGHLRGSRQLAILEHQTENNGALLGDLPDAAMCERMVKYMETIPGFDKLASMPWYPGKNYDGTIRWWQKGKMLRRIRSVRLIGVVQ